ncbi:MAG TPA: glycosyltransferase family 39 protein [Chloroflexia bacterium]|nr:glycosyltransferase family 39 protein [Chloroflexia bacterium]
MIATHSRYDKLRYLAPAVLLVAGCAALITYLLARFPYDGLYGQDSYAYYYQSLALRQDITGQPQPPWSLFNSQAFRWPIGYHLHVIAGSFFGDGHTGAWLLTLTLTALTPALVYLVLGQLWEGASLRSRVIGGLIAGSALVMTGTYMRFGISLMADVPALCWSLLGTYSFLKAWPPCAQPNDKKSNMGWAVVAGGALGLAVLVRYGSVLLFVPLLVYMALRWRQSRLKPIWGPKLWLAFAAFVVALLPEALYLLTHASGAGYSAFLSDWNIANTFSRTVTSNDGIATFDYPNIVFYLLFPLANAGTGFLAYSYMPLMSLGLAILIRERKWPILGLLLSWWLVPALVFSGTPYQAHRFVLAYLPALVIMIGIGGAVAVEFVLKMIPSRRESRALLFGILAALLLELACLGAYQGWQSVRQWVGAHAAFKVEEQGVVSLARSAIDPDSTGAQPRVVSFGITSALSHYTHWPALDFYIYDETAIQSFFEAPGPRLVVLPEESMYEQWKDAPSGKRWLWIREHYALTKVGESGVYTVYEVEGVR